MKKTLTILLFLLTTFFFSSQQMLAQDFTVNGINYSGSAATLTATLVAPTDRENCSGDIIIPSTVVYGGNTYTVTKIGQGAFEYTHVTSVSLPNTITEIGNFAFYCQTLKSIDLSEGVTHIGECAFANTIITSIRIPQSVTYIGKDAFASQTLESVTMEEGVTYIGERAFSTSNISSIQIPQSVIHIGQGAFADCESLSRIDVVQGNKNYCSEDGILYSINKDTLFCFPPTRQEAYHTPLSLRVIDSYAFWGSNASSVVLSDSLKYIGCQAFFRSKVTSIIAPNTSALYAADDAFSSCSKLDTIIFSSKANLDKSFGWDDERYTHLIYFYDKEKNEVGLGCSIPYAFVVDRSGYGTRDLFGYIRNCVVPESIKINGNQVPVTNIVLNAFDKCIIDSLTIPNTIKKIGTCFKRCNKIFIKDLASWVQIDFYNPVVYNEIYLNGSFLSGDIKIPETVTHIGDNAFSFYKYISTVSIPNSVKTIGKYAFVSSSLCGVTLGNSVKSIGAEAFSYTYLKSLFIPASVKNIESPVPDSIAKRDRLYYDPYYFDKSLTEINVAADNPTYCSVDGVVYNHAKDSLIIFPQGREGKFSVPEGVTTIAQFAFCNSLVDTVTISNTVTSIERGAFYSSDNLKMLTIPASVCHIGNYAFAYDYLLKTICSMLETPLEFNLNPFDESGNIILYVPDNSINAYKNAPYWKDFNIYSVEDFLNSIKEVKTNASDSKSGICYDLQGHRIDTPTTKGIYIRNGKKFMIK